MPSPDQIEKAANRVVDDFSEYLAKEQCYPPPEHLDELARIIAAALAAMDEAEKGAKT